MWAAPAARSVTAMTTSTHIRRRAGAVAVAVAAALLAAALTLWPAAGDAADRTQTLRFFSKDVSLKLTSSDGTVVTQPPFPDAKPGDVLDLNSLLFRGDHRRHAKRSNGSTHLQCRFTAAPEPDCVSHVAIGGSLLVFSGNPGTLVNGTGRFQDATGRVVSAEEVPGGNDVVARIKLRAR